MHTTVGNGRPPTRSTSGLGAWVVILLIVAELIVAVTMGSAAGNKGAGKKCDPAVRTCKHPETSASPSATPSPTPEPEATVAPTPEASAAPSPDASPTPDPEPTQAPEPSSTQSPEASPTTSTSSPSKTDAPAPPSSGSVFTAGSYWNTRLPVDAPVASDSDAMIGFIRSRATLGYVRLGGLSSTGAWGLPIYHASSTDPLVTVTKACPLGGNGVLHADATRVPMPTNAGGAADNDGAALVYAGPKAIAYMELIRTSPTTATACGSSTYYTDSNGLDGSLPESDQPLNIGHRGVPGPTYAVTWEEIKAGHIDHRLKIAVPASSTGHVWPMTGSDGDSTDAAAIPQGAVLRIDPSLQLTTLGLSPAALTVARALQTYGAVVGDTSGSSAILKVENTIAEGRGWLWKDVLGPHSLSAIPLSALEVVKPGYRP